MLLNFFLIISSLLFNSCGDKEQPGNESQAKPALDDPEYVLRQAKNVLGNDVKFAYPGLFDSDSIAAISAGTEIQNKDMWGIKFYLLKQDGNTYAKHYESDLLEGSFSECLVKKIKFPAFNYELLYYSSQDYFLGSGGGEIFSYIIDFNNKHSFYAHLFIEQGQPVSLFLSPNIPNPDVKNFFISNFKRDYPSLTLVSKDIDLKY